MKIRRRRKKKSLKGMILLIVFVLAAIGFVYFIKSDFFSVQNISVQGASSVSEEEIIEKSGLRTGMNLFDFNARKVQDSIKSISKIKNVSVMRVYPNGVKIIVTERSAYVNIIIDSICYELDDEGVVLRVGQLDPNSRAVILSGLKDIQMPEPGGVFDYNSVPSVKIAYSALEYFRSQGMYDQIMEIYVSPVGYYYIYTAKSTVIKFLSWPAFTSNQDFIRLFVLNEDRKIMVEVVEGSNPVYKIIDIK